MNTKFFNLLTHRRLGPPVLPTQKQLAIISSIHQSCAELATPYFFFDEEKLLSNYSTLSSMLPNKRVKIFFSVKANNNSNVLTSLIQSGSGFDVASLGEIELLRSLGASCEHMTFSSTVKLPLHIKKAYEYGVRLFAADSPYELEKLSKLAPGSKVFIRIGVSNKGSLWPLIHKFGCSPDEAVSLLLKAKELGLVPYGVAFHVGSQCLRPASWIDALRQVKYIWYKANAIGIQLQMINLGGGIPAFYKEAVPSVADIGRVVDDFIVSNFPNTVEVMVEPGRSMVANIGVLVTSVVSKATRMKKEWIYADVSIYSGLLEAIEKWDYTIFTDKTDSEYNRDYVVAGPTCDSTDIISFGTLLPEISVGDKLYIFSAGAYTVSYQAYNGYSFPPVYFSSVDSSSRM
jgi:ornithine decarboxylase